MKFKYKDLDGNISEASFSDLDVVAEGPVNLSEGWQGDRINCSRTLSIYIEFRSGPESPPGVVPSDAIQVTKDYVQSSYGVSI